MIRIDPNKFYISRQQLQKQSDLSEERKNQKIFKYFQMSIRGGFLKNIQKIVKEYPDLNLCTKECTFYQDDLYFSNHPVFVNLTNIQPIHVASYHGWKEIVEWLITNCKINPNVQTSDRSTPLHFAMFGLNVDTVTILLKNGADPMITDNSNQTPLQAMDDIKNTYKIRMDTGPISQQKMENIRKLVKNFTPWKESK